MSTQKRDEKDCCCSGGSRGAPPPLFWVKRKESQKGEKPAGRAVKNCPPLSSRSGSANITYDLLEVRRTDDVTINKILPFYHMKQIHFMLPCISLAVDHQRRQNVIKNKNSTHSCASCATFVSYHIICQRRQILPQSVIYKC